MGTGMGGTTGHPISNLFIRYGALAYGKARHLYQEGLRILRSIGTTGWFALRKEFMRDTSAAADASAVQEAIDCAQETVSNRFAEFAHNFSVPECQPICVLWAG